MKSAIAASLLAAALMALATVPATAGELTVDSVLTAKQAGATTDGIIAMVNDPANTVVMSASDLVTLRNAGVSESLIAAIWTRLPPEPGSPTPLVPDDVRLVDLVKLIKSGISESIVNEQVKQSGQPYNLSVNDLLYLKQNGILESTITALMATSAIAPGKPPSDPKAVAVVTAPESLVFDGLVMKAGLMRKSRPGRLVMQGNVLAWKDGADPKENFEFQISGLEKVWFTCQARTPENFCYQLNFQIVKGDRYAFQDANRDAGGNAAVLDVMAALRKNFPQVAYGSPKG